MSIYQKIVQRLLELDGTPEGENLYHSLLTANAIMERLPEYEHKTILWAVLGIQEESGISTRRSTDYPPTERQKQAWKENGRKLGKSPESMAARIEAGHKRKGQRAREYEFGGHEKRRPDGYIKVYVPDHPHATADGYVAKHTLVMERSIGRYLSADEVVHHINHIRDDNRLENLLLMTKHDHQALHMRERHEERRKQSC